MYRRSSRRRLIDFYFHRSRAASYLLLWRQPADFNWRQCVRFLPRDASVVLGIIILSVSPSVCDERPSGDCVVLSDGYFWKKMARLLCLRDLEIEWVVVPSVCLSVPPCVYYSLLWRVLGARAAVFTTRHAVLAVIILSILPSVGLSRVRCFPDGAKRHQSEMNIPPAVTTGEGFTFRRFYHATLARSWES